MNARTRRRAVHAQIDKPTLRELASTLLADGHDADEVIRQVVRAIDAAVDWVAIGSAAGPVGTAVGVGLEAVDGPIATAIATSIVRAAERRRATRPSV